MEHKEGKLSPPSPKVDAWFTFLSMGLPVEAYSSFCPEALTAELSLTCTKTYPPMLHCVYNFVWINTNG
jgi:hypothetical protein